MIYKPLSWYLIVLLKAILSVKNDYNISIAYKYKLKPIENDIKGKYM